MHVHSFIFILLALAIFLQALGVNTEPFWFSLLFIVPLYIYLAMKYFYRQGWGKTLLKYLVIGMIYIFIFSMCSVATLVLGFVFF